MIEEIKSFTAEQIEERSAQIVTEIEQADEARLAELNEEIKALEARKAEIELENRKADMVALAQGADL
mgnify:FL=1